MSGADNHFKPGDVVAILAHTHVPYLYPDRSSQVPASSGWVITGKSSFHRRSGDWLSPSDQFTLEKLPEVDEGWNPNRFEFIQRSNLVLEKRGSGVFTRGVDLPFNLSQERVIRFEKFRSRVAAAIIMRGKHEGWVNPATWHVNLHLTNCQHFINNLLPGLQRKNGTVNPSRLQKVWNDLKRQKKVEAVEDWMYESLIDVPSEFARWSIAELQALRVDWNELAAEFRRK